MSALAREARPHYERMAREAKALRNRREAIRETLFAAGCYVVVVFGIPAAVIGAAYLRGWRP